MGFPPQWNSGRVLMLLAMHLLTLLLCASPPAVLSKDTYLGNTRPLCRDPEACCAHPFNSDKFEACCEEQGCCPVECPETTEAGKQIIASLHCPAWECCIYRGGSPGHQACCKRHGCCPRCQRLGCCYNGLKYAVRTVVQDLPDVCVQLVCSAKLLPNFPYIVSTITAVKTCSFNDMSAECVGCPVHHCVDESGLVRVEGEEWSPSRCTECECRGGHVRCKGIVTVCPSPPHSGCVALLGPCCPTYHCEEGCFDEDGVFKPLASEWPSKDPCKIMICTENGIDTVEIACLPPPPPHSGCFLQPVPGQCCPEWDCSRCLDDDGTFHALHEEWASGLCFVKVCTVAGILESRVICTPLGAAPHASCYKDVMEGRCCQEWRCDGCWEGGVLHAPGSQWPSSDPCFNKECTDAGVVPRRVDCPDFPRPHESCFEYIPDRECCPTWNCSGCVDENGTYHPLYHEWQTDPCTTLFCHLHGITKKEVSCPPLGPAPHVTCYPTQIPDECCQEWKCDGCLDAAGVFHLLGSEWPSSSDPCQVMKCLSGGVIDTKTIDCNDGSAPHDGCALQPVEGQCCRQWNCSGCWDAEGKFRKIDEQWNSDPCTSRICTLSGIQTSQVACRAPPRPMPHCRLVLVPGECCPTWDCKHYRPRSAGSCTDHEGIERVSGEQWVMANNSCTTWRCRSGLVSEEPVKCQLPPRPSLNCFEEQRVCCGAWNCSGCLDKGGKFHPLGESWTSICTTYTCTLSGLTTEAVTCPAAPSPTCRPEQSQSCCPTWLCEEKDYGSLPKPDCGSAPCRGPPFNADCMAVTTKGDCCPSYSCLPPKPSKPDCDPEYCAGPPLYQHCTVHTPLDKCCPVYTCSPSATPRPVHGCKAGLCLAPPSNVPCTSTPPRDTCCPVFDCK